MLQKRAIFATFTRLDSLQDSNRYKTAPNLRHAWEKSVFKMSFAQQTAPMTRQHPLQDSNLYKTSFLLFYNGFLIKTTPTATAAATPAARAAAKLQQKSGTAATNSGCCFIIINKY